jgi:hypothetical protein
MRSHAHAMKDELTIQFIIISLSLRLESEVGVEE